MRASALMFVLFAAAGLGGPAGEAQSAWPAKHPDAWGLAIVDIETTGLDPAYHDMIDLGVIYADLEGRELGRLFVRIMPENPDRIDPGAAAVNGFSTPRWRELGAVSEAEAAAQLLAFHNAASVDNPSLDGTPRTWLFTAYNAWFDRAFLDALLVPNGSSTRDLYHYFQLDLPSLAWGAGVRDLKNGDVAAALGLPDESRDPLEHTGLSGAEWNLDIYRAVRTKSATMKPHAPE